MSFESLTLTEIRQELQTLNIDVSTGILRGEERKAALLERLRQATPQRLAQQQKPLLGTSSINSKTVPMNELRSKCEELGISTLTHGLTGEARYQELMKRISFTEPEGVEAIGEEEDDRLKDRRFDEPHNWSNEVNEPSINWGGNRRVFDDDDDDDEEDDGVHYGDNIVDNSDEDSELSFDETYEPDNHSDNRGMDTNNSDGCPSHSLPVSGRTVDQPPLNSDIIRSSSTSSSSSSSPMSVHHDPIIKPNQELNHHVIAENTEIEKEEAEIEEIEGYDNFNDQLSGKQKLNLDISTALTNGSEQGKLKQDSPAPLQSPSVPGATYFASLLTPRLSSEELSCRLRVIKRELRALMDNRASAIGYRSHGECADLEILTAQKQHNKVQEELKRVRSEQGASMLKSRLVDAGKKMSFPDLQFKLATMEVALFKQLNDARKQIIKEENQSPAHGTDAEMAMNAQIVVLTRALTAAKEQEETERLSRYELEMKQGELNNPMNEQIEGKSEGEKENFWQPPGGPPLILENPKGQRTHQPNVDNTVAPSLDSHPTSPTNQKGRQDTVKTKLSPGDLLLQRALKLVADIPKTSKKRMKKIPEPKVKEIESKFLESIKYARVSLESDPGLLPKALMHWGSFLFQVKDDLETARVVFAEALDEAENVSCSQRVMGSVCAEYASFLSKCRETVSAEQVYLKGLSADASHPRLLGNYARLLTSRGEYARADLLFSQALAIAPLHGPTLINRAQLLKTLGKVAEAEVLLRKAASESSDPTHRAQGANNLANFLWRVKADLAGAKQAYINGIVEAKGGADKLLQRNYAMFLSRNKEMRGSTLPLAELPGQKGGSVLGVLEEAEDPYDEMSTLDASVVKRILASNRANQLSETFEED